MKEIDKILTQNEKILWEGKPLFLPYFFTSLLPLFFIALFFFGPILFIWIQSKISLMLFAPLLRMFPPEALSSASSHSLFTDPILGGFLFMGFFIIFTGPLYNILVFRNIYYVITDKRVIVQNGLIARGFEIIDFDKVANAGVRIGFFDRLFGHNTGSIFVSPMSANTTYVHSDMFQPTLSNIRYPYDVFKFFEKVSYDIKTDIQYPNQLRPKENPGYQTEYDPQAKRPE